MAISPVSSPRQAISQHHERSSPRSPGTAFRIRLTDQSPTGRRNSIPSLNLGTSSVCFDYSSDGSSTSHSSKSAESNSPLSSGGRSPMNRASWSPGRTLRNLTPRRPSSSTCIERSASIDQFRVIEKKSSSFELRVIGRFSKSLVHEGITTGHLQEKIDSTINRMLADQYDAASSGATDVEPNICSLIQKTVRNPPFLFYDIHDRFLTMRNSFIDALHKKRTTKLVALYNKINDLIKIVDPARRYENEYLKDFFERKELLQAIDELDNDQKALIMRHINPDTNEARKVITYVTSMLSRTGLSLVNAKITGIFANWKRGAAFCRELPNCCFIWKPDARQYHLLQEYSDPNHQITRTLVSDKTFLPRSLMINGKQFEIVEADWKGDERKMVLGKLLCRLNANGFGWEASESTAKKVAKSYLNNPDSTRLDPKFNLLRLMTFPGQAIADDRFRCAFPCLDDGDVVAKPLDGSKYTIDIDSKSQLEEGSYSISWSRDFELRKKIGQDVIGRPNIDMTSKKLGTFVLKSILDARYVGGSVTFSGRFFIDHLNIDERNEPMLIHAIRSAITDYDVDSVTEMPREKG